MQGNPTGGSCKEAASVADRKPKPPGAQSDQPHALDSDRRRTCLAAAQVNTQVEFDRTYRTLSKEQGYQNRNLLFIAGLNIDISPREDQVFPLTKFIPWAAYVQSASSEHRILEQRELYDALMASDSENPHKIDLEEAIAVMEKTKEVSISFEFRKSG